MGIGKGLGIGIGIGIGVGVGLGIGIGIGTGSGVRVKNRAFARGARIFPRRSVISGSIPTCSSSGWIGNTSEKL